MKEKFYYTIKETVYNETLDNGLEVYLLQKPGFTKTYGLFTTRFGSIDTTFIPINEKEMIKVEDGIAHFLEHKMFEMKDGDITDTFSLLGASSNAYTSSSRTAYLYSTTQNVEECTTTLLDFVQDLYLTDENVEKEKGIIAQEIQMYEDDPDWKLYFGSIASLYQKHPVGVDIAGSVESVYNTSKEMLEKCYETFYHPSNMCLFIVGNFEPIEMMKLIKENQSKKTFETPQPIRVLDIDEPLQVKEKRVELPMDVSMPKIMVSTKINERIEDSKENLIRSMAIGMLLDIYFSKSSSAYTKWMKAELINDSFGAIYTQERDYAFIQIGGDTFKYQELENEIYDLYKEIQTIDISDELFNRLKKKNLGSFLNLFNSPDNIANMFIKYHFEGVDPFEIIDIIYDMDKEDLLKVRKYFDKEYSSTFIITPTDNK